MKKAPNPGDKVRNRLPLWGGTVEGTVIKVYPEHRDELDDGGNIIAIGKLAPEREWWCSVRVDNLPPDWPYPGNCYCPLVKELELI